MLDLDGTLTDPREGITRCIQYALERLDRPVPAQDELLDCIGPPLHGSFVRLLDGDAQLATRAVLLYRERFADVGLYENVPYPGIAEAMDRLHAGGVRLYLATSKPTVYARRIVEHFDLAGRLDGTFGSELDGRLTDKAELLAHALEQTGLRPQQALMVGDRYHDVRGARANRMEAFGVSWGFGTREELLSAGAADVLDSVDQLATLLDLQPGQRPTA
jgi:phosphoglycolate phosphatase